MWQICRKIMTCLSTSADLITHSIQFYSHLIWLKSNKKYMNVFIYLFLRWRIFFCLINQNNFPTRIILISYFVWYLLYGYDYLSVQIKITALSVYSTLFTLSYFIILLQIFIYCHLIVSWFKCDIVDWYFVIELNSYITEFVNCNAIYWCYIAAHY